MNRGLNAILIIYFNALFQDGETGEMRYNGSLPRNAVKIERYIYIVT